MTANDAYGNFVVGGIMLVCVVACVSCMLMDRWVTASSDDRNIMIMSIFYLPLFGIVIGFSVLLGVVAVLRNMGYDLPVFHSAVWASELR